jgi:hypothetical protein
VSVCMAERERARARGRARERTRDWRTVSAADSTASTAKLELEDSGALVLRDELRVEEESGSWGGASKVE